MIKGWIFEGGTPPLPLPRYYFWQPVFCILRNSNIWTRGTPYLIPPPHCMTPAFPLALALVKSKKYFTILDSFLVTSDQ